MRLAELPLILRCYLNGLNEVLDVAAHVHLAQALGHALKRVHCHGGAPVAVAGERAHRTKEGRLHRVEGVNELTARLLHLVHIHCARLRPPGHSLGDESRLLEQVGTLGRLLIFGSLLLLHRSQEFLLVSHLLREDQDDTLVLLGKGCLDLLVTQRIG